MQHQRRNRTFRGMILAAAVALICFAGYSTAHAQCPGAGNCYQVNGSPGCDNTNCCNTVCNADPFCCNNTWDQLCVDQAFELCGDCGGPNAGNCYISNGSPGCNNEECCQTVCVQDPFCCNNTWDQLCADQAFELCGNCGDFDAGNCYVPNGSPGCNNEECCQAVCINDPFCCNVAWDDLCAGDAFTTCGNCGDPEAGNCYLANGTPGCSNEECCQSVCVSDPFCCNTEWDDLCAEGAANLCDNCGNPNAGNCYVANGTPGCNNEDCCTAVCAEDPFCCNNEWDQLCADQAFDLCGNCGDFDAGNCYVANGSPGCNDADCCQAICINDPFCCNVAWDSICASDAFSTCGNCGDSAAGNCYISNGSPGCDNADCCEAICVDDPFCCNVAWDGICASDAFTTCGNCGNANAGSCFSPNPTPGCDDLGCCSLVCADDPFCCNVEWDSLCSDAAINKCDQTTCPGDLTGDGNVGVADLLELLAAWGPNAGHPADLDGNGSVGVSDLLILLAAWGPCP